MSRYLSFNLLLAAFVAAIAVIPQAGFADEASDVRVMSFNIRFGTARDGENHWDNRCDFVVETIKAFQPDLLGTQETLKFQRDFLAKHLPEYEVLGVGRDDGKDAGEMMALYYRRDRFEQLDAGHFWLSETPEGIGSKSWDSALPRMVTWVKLKDRKAAEAAPIMFFNAHFDHRGAEARHQSSLLVRKRAAAVAGGCRIVVTGDFNAGESSDPYKAMFGEVGGTDSALVDSFRVTHPDATPDDGTFSGFKAAETKGARIDWIGVSRNWIVRRADIDRTERDGRTPSDHFPVTAVLGNE